MFCFWFLGLALTFMNSSGFLRVGYDFKELLWISMKWLWFVWDFYGFFMVRLWFLQFCLDGFGFVWIFRVHPDFYELVEISIHCLWFLEILSEFYLLVMISMRSFWISMDRSWFLKCFLMSLVKSRFLELTLILMNLCGFLCNAYDFCEFIQNFWVLKIIF